MFNCFVFCLVYVRKVVCGVSRMICAMSSNVGSRKLPYARSFGARWCRTILRSCPVVGMLFLSNSSFHFNSGHLHLLISFRRNTCTSERWRLAFGVWRLAFGVWRLAFGVWRLAFGVWRLACGVLRFAFGVWRLAFSVWRLEFCV